MMRIPQTVPILTLEPATPTIAVPAPMNWAAVWMRLEVALVWMLWLGLREVKGHMTTKWPRPSSVGICGCFSFTADNSAVTQQLRGAPDQGAVLLIREQVGKNLEQPYMFRVRGQDKRAAPRVEKTERGLCVCFYL